MKTLVAGTILFYSLALVGCSRAIAPPALPAAIPAVANASAPQVRLRIAGSLADASDVAKLVATQRGFSGPFTFATSDSRVIELLSVPPPAGHQSAITSPSGTIWGYASGAGTVTITARGANASTQRTFIVKELGRVDVDPPALGFFGPTNGKGKRVTVSQSNFNGKFGESDNCKGHATVRALSNARGNATYVVRPGGIGSCQAWFAGGTHLSGAALAISVQP
jgi:hypothetical protein